jgi:flagellar motor switch protein FliN/FliY
VSDTPENASDAGSVDQSDIDALFGGGSDAAPSPPAQAAAPATGGEIDQNDIDALLGAGASGSADPAVTLDAGGAVDQGDIDALMAAAGGGEEGSSVDGGAPPEPDTRVDTLGRPFDEVAAAMQAALEEEAAAAPAAVAASSPPPGSQPFDFPTFGAFTPTNVDPARVTMLNDVNLGVRIELGRTKMLVEEVLRLDEGSVVELDRLAGDPVDVFANDRLVARGEVLVLNDSFCVRISEVFSRDPHRVVQ